MDSLTSVTHEKKEDGILMEPITKIEVVMMKDCHHFQALYAQESIDYLQDNLCKCCHHESMAHINGHIEEDKMLKAEMDKMKV